MKLLGNTRTLTKFLIFALLAIAVMAVIGWKGSTIAGEIKQSNDKIYSQYLLGCYHLEEIKTYYLRHQNDLLYYILSADDNARLRMEGYQTGLKDQFIIYELFAKDLPNQEAIKNLQTSFTKYYRVSKQISDLVKRGQQADALNLYITKTTGIDGTIRDQLRSLNGTNEMAAKAEKTAADIQYKAGMTQLMVMAFLGGFLTLLCAFFFAGAVTHQTKDVVGIIKKMAAGDFTNKIKVEGKGEIGLITAELAKMSENISNLVSRIYESAVAVSLDAKTIIDGNQDLSQRTQEQASTLEEIASTIEEINFSIQQMVTNSEQINTLSRQTLEIVVDGENSVKESKESMNHILVSSKRIAEITKVVNQIASQTNLLALNASVEAARSGEQGRGFAVVAAEIRNLATRSAASAKEIENLIKESGELINHGNEMVNKSALILEKIVSNTKETATEILTVAGTIQEEADALQQIETSVEQLNQVTQENAGLVVLNSSSSQSLGVVAENLKDLIEEFKTSGTDKLTSEPVNLSEYIK